MTDSSTAAAAVAPPREHDNPITRLTADRWMLGLMIGGFFALVAAAFTPKTITGLPAHPLLLHMPVIFVPCLTVAAIVLAVNPQWRKQYGIAYGIGAIVTAFGTLVAAQAGEAYLYMKTGLAEGQQPSAAVAADPEFKLLQRHASLGGDTKVVVALLAAAILVQILIDRGILPKISEKFKNARALPAMALSGVIILLAAAAGGFTMWTGHEGAKATFGEEGRGGPRDRAGAARPGGRQLAPAQGDRNYDGDSR